MQMNIPMGKRTICLIIALAMCSVAHAQKSKDFVWDDGKMIAGEIQSVSADGIAIKEKGSAKTIPVDRITKVRFGDEPSSLSRIRSDIEEGQVEQASKSLAKLKPEGRDFVKQDIEFYKAMLVSRSALQGDGDLTKAGKVMKAFIRSNTNSIRYYEACEMMGDLAMNLGKFGPAASYYGRLAKSKARGVVARGNLLQGDALFLQENPSGALQMYQVSAKASDPTLKNLAKIGVAKCQAAAGKHDAAIQQIEKIIADNSSEDAELFARANNALGYAFEKAGNSDASLESYLKTDLLFYRARPQHAEALYHLGKLWSVANKPAESGKARKKLKDYYGASLWAKK